MRERRSKFESASQLVAQQRAVTIDEYVSAGFDFSVGRNLTHVLESQARSRVSHQQADASRNKEFVQFVYRCKFS